MCLLHNLDQLNANHYGFNQLVLDLEQGGASRGAVHSLLKKAQLNLFTQCPDLITPQHAFAWKW